MADDKKPEKIRVSRKTGKKIRQTGSNPPQGDELLGRLGQILRKLKGS